MRKIVRSDILIDSNVDLIAGKNGQESRSSLHVILARDAMSRGHRRIYRHKHSVYSIFTNKFNCSDNNKYI